MTAEVAIANGYAVALAADSAVTVGGRKIYNSAVKLFSLSKVHPVGIMIYGNASLLDVPWETIIKTSRQSLKDTKFDTLEEYGGYFINFIQNHSFYFSEQSQTTWITNKVGGVFTAIKESFIKEANNLFSKGEAVDDAKTLEILTPLIDKPFETLKHYPFIDGFDVTTDRTIKNEYKELFKNLISNIFEKVPLTKKMTARLNNIAVHLLTKNYFSNGVSGIVIAGFGDAEIFPSLITYEIEGFLKEGLRYKLVPGKSRKVKSGGDCTIVPFAQEDMVYAFMRGMNPSVNTLFHQSLDRIFQRLPDLIDEGILSAAAKTPDEIKGDFKSKTDTLLEEFKTTLEAHVNEMHVNPVLSMVASLPKDELAAMAESLVNLTAFKRRMSENLETVGGPIDVAVISKGDGLVWVKRKLYFPKDLNDHFFQNYYRGF